MSKHVPGKNWYAEYKTNKNIHLTHIWPHTHTDVSHLFSSIPGNGIVGCDPEEVVANSGRRLLRGPWSKIVKIASSLKSLEKEFWEIYRELSPCYSLVILAFVRWRNGENMATPHGYPVVRTTQQGVRGPVPRSGQQEHRQDYFANRDGCHLHRGDAHHSGRAVGLVPFMESASCHENTHMCMPHPTK